MELRIDYGEMGLKFVSSSKGIKERIGLYRVFELARNT